jgi:hypothetical protein
MYKKRIDVRTTSEKTGSGVGRRRVTSINPLTFAVHWLTVAVIALGVNGCVYFTACFDVWAGYDVDGSLVYEGSGSPVSGATIELTLQTPTGDLETWRNAGPEIMTTDDAGVFGGFVATGAAGRCVNIILEPRPDVDLDPPPLVTSATILVYDVGGEPVQEVHIEITEDMMSTLEETDLQVLLHLGEIRVGISE